MQASSNAAFLTHKTWHRNGLDNMPRSRIVLTSITTFKSLGNVPIDVEVGEQALPALSR